MHLALFFLCKRIFLRKATPHPPLQVQPEDQRVRVLDDGQLPLLRRDGQRHRHHPAVEEVQVLCWGQVSGRLFESMVTELHARAQVDHRGHRAGGGEAGCAPEGEEPTGGL